MGPVIEIRTGSDSDIPKIRAAHETLAALGVPFYERVLSAHRTPRLMADEAARLEEKGVRVSIAAAGGAAHLPGMTASETLVPVVGIPVPTEALGGLDSLYSIVQMPEGCPVGAVGVGQAKAAATLAARIVALGDPALSKKLGPEDRLPAPRRVALRGVPAPKETLDLLERFGMEVGDEDPSVLIAICDAASLDLPAKVAAGTSRPVIALPLLKGRVDPFERLLGDAPVACMGINRPKNAAIYAAMIAGERAKLREYREELRRESEAKDAKLTSSGTRRP
jgi:5-(carboxyamino)imidazole ribonucleotide mutase